MHTIRYLARLDLLVITWSGLFTPEGMQSYAEDCQTCLERERFRAGYKLRIVIADNKPLPQDTLAVLEKVFGDFPKAGRIAMVTESSIMRLQIRRTMLVPHMDIFETPEAAMTWLMRPDEFS